MEGIFDDIKVIAYFLWEYTHSDNALGLWTCAEDIACHFEEFDLSMDDFAYIKGLSKYDYNYISLLREIAYRIYVYTGNEDHIFNWFVAERLIENGEWCNAIVKVASFYGSQKQNDDFVSGIRSLKVRKFYSSQIIGNGVR